MKHYEPCEVKIRFFATEDVITASQPTVNGYTKDGFTDDNWYAQGGTD